VDATTFWKIIAAGGKAVQDDPDAQLEAIGEKLSDCSPEEIVSFQTMLEERLVQAYTVDLWGAAYLMNGGCSDDGFLYFRLWLVARGQKVYEAAVANPDSLARIADPENDDLELELLISLAAEVYEETTGDEIPAANVKWPDAPIGTNWDYDDDAAMRAHFPKLAAIYLEE
jgi:hypothetical protein